VTDQSFETANLDLKYDPLVLNPAPPLPHPLSFLCFFQLLVPLEAHPGQAYQLACLLSALLQRHHRLWRLTADNE
jgi:hypothetical protein